MRTLVWERGHNILGLKHIQDIFKYEKLNYLSFTAIEDSTISMKQYGNTNTVDIKYSYDGQNWIRWDYLKDTISLSKGTVVYMKGDNSSGFNTSDSGYKYFSMTGKIAAGGNIMSILYNDDFEDKYTIPCASCYNSMFENCTSLVTAPDLSATILTPYCYNRMFYGCTSLNHVKMLATDISAESCLTNWVYNVASNGTFIKHQNMTSLPTGYDGVPEGWTVINI